MAAAQQGQRLELECQISRITWGASWFRLDKDGKLYFIVSSNSLYNTIIHEDKRVSQHFEVSWRDGSPWLVVKSFTAQDQGIYFCISFINQVLQFSLGQPAFFPVETTAATTTTTATTQSSPVTKKNSTQQGSDAVTQMWGGRGSASSATLIRRAQIQVSADYRHFRMQADVCNWDFPLSSLSFLPAGTSNENTPHLCHDTVIWVNLAGTCLLLLLTAITINIVHCRSKLHSDTLQSFLE
ncbi:LOW QUALITY PROTEIN: T-cell surface glycoprotein CD8 alpha chain-like, partial [Coturnix japonica]|uniref:LOW QUALITY PROTEIN: T-cell surface glycoprotein CD8 alpha chain-like n=1 Tax=Coturnix japonica TaxID=93934 RepID=UPI0013A5E894